MRTRGGLSSVLAGLNTTGWTRPLAAGGVSTPVDVPLVPANTDQGCC